MTLKKLRKEFLEELGEKLSAFGYNKKVRGHSFYRPTEFGWNSVHVTIINHADDFDVTIDVSVRFNEIEDLVNNHGTYLNARGKKLTATMGVELGNLSIGQQKRWTISSEQQISTVVESAVDFYEKHGEPYLLKYSSVDAAYDVLSRDDRIGWLNCPIHDKRAMGAIAIAKLQNHPNIQEQIETREKFLENQPNTIMSNFKAFIKSIS